MISDWYCFFHPDLEFQIVNRVKSFAILNLALAFPKGVATLAGLWKTSVLLMYVDIFVGKFVMVFLLGLFGRSSLLVHL